MKPPLSVILVRHGARLDKADASWSSSSPTPYDSPMTHDGWKNSEALGMRIGSIFHQFEHKDSRVDSPLQDSSTPRSFRDEQSRIRDKRVLNVVIHSSPYLRCTQTALAVSSGIARAYDESRCADQSEKIHSGREGIVEDSERQEPNSRSSSPAAQLSMGGPGFCYTNASPEFLSPRNRKVRIKLRLDAFLGEWLTADYFEHMYTPPNAAHLLETAKTDLLRGLCGMDDDSADTRHNVVTKERPTYFHTTEGGRQAIATNSLSERDLKPQDHTSNQGYARNNYKKCDIKLSTTFSKELSLSDRSERELPSCGISSQSEPIPQGVIDQAKNKHVEVDSQWDSTKEPLLWGDAGELGEGWSSMHQRLNTGLYNLLDWYTNEELHNLRPSEATDTLSTGEFEPDTVLIIITHGAACNALIGGFTNQPVVVDVGTSSFTMFVRKENVSEENWRCLITPRMNLPASPSDLSSIYSLKLLATTEHLQADVDLTKIPYNPLIHSSTLYRPEHERQTGLITTRTRNFSHLSIGVPKNIDSSTIRTSEQTDFSTGYMKRNSPEFNISPKIHITGLRFWSDLVLSPKEASLENNSDSSSEDNYLLNFASVSHACET